MPTRSPPILLISYFKILYSLDFLRVLSAYIPSKNISLKSLPNPSPLPFSAVSSNLLLAVVNPAFVSCNLLFNDSRVLFLIESLRLSYLSLSDCTSLFSSPSASIRAYEASLYSSLVPVPLSYAD